MRAAAVLALAAAAGCGDDWLGPGAALRTAPDLTVVAHPDDDLLFMQPDLGELAEARAGLVNVYVTAGNGSHGVDAAERRYLGLMAAYSAATGQIDSAPDAWADGWACGWIELAGQPAEHCRLEAADLSLVFLGYPDGGKQGEQRDSLLRLWRGDIPAATAVSDETWDHRRARFDREGLIAAVAAVISQVEPRTIRTLEIAGTHGRDHADHLVTGPLALVSAAAARSSAQLISYRGYATADEPENLAGASYQRSLEVLAHYEACATGCARCGSACAQIDPVHADWLHRRYAVATWRAGRGALHADDGACAELSGDGAVALTRCGPMSTQWRLSPDGLLRAGERCLTAVPDGSVAAELTCDGGPAQRWRLDDDGHLWSGEPPQAATEYAHLRCLSARDGAPRVELCGAGHAPTWRLAPTVTASAITLPPLPGRAIRLGDLTGDRRADLCFVDAGGLRCAPGSGDGAFAPAVAIGGGLTVEPESLALGDLDGDHRLDACGRDAAGVRCALAATGFVAEPWTPTFSRSGDADPTDRSLTLADVDGDGADEVCGLEARGVVCTPRGPASAAQVSSPWPSRDAPMWVDDLDGDHLADWCVTDPAGGAACGPSAERARSSDGAAWSYASAGLVDRAPRTAALGALGDLDGDGRADLCSADAREVRCARSQGRGFGPSTALAVLPPASHGRAVTALWLGDLDGDDVLDACVEDGVAILCARR